MTRPLQFPETVRAALERLFRSRRKRWLAGEGAWPLSVNLGCPNESEALRRLADVRAWTAAWHASPGAGEIVWAERRWRAIGVQSLPDRLLLKDAEAVAVWAGEDAAWRRARIRYLRMTTRRPELASRLARHYDVLAGYAEEDLQRVESMLAWLQANPRSNLYPRQLPIPGLDTKWIEGRKGLIADLLGALRGEREERGEGDETGSLEGGDFFQLCGLRRSPILIRMRILDRELRNRLGGLSDLMAPAAELALLGLPAARVFIVENLQTGLAFDDLPGAVVVMGLGYGVDVLASIPWIARAECFYWGDIDTHGFAILSRARSRLPALRSILMDEPVLLENRPLWVEEPQQNPAAALPSLTNEEQAVYRGLKQHRWGVNVRLEQERIEWPKAWMELQARRRILGESA